MSRQEVVGMDLKIYLVKNRLSVSEFAEMIDYSRPHLSAVIHGRQLPSPKLARIIERVTGGKVKATSWKKAKRKKDNGKD